MQKQDTSTLDAVAAWEVKKAPREAQAAAKAAKLAQSEAERASYLSRCADLSALAYHPNANVRHFSRAPVKALTDLERFVKDARAETSQATELLSETLHVPAGPVATDEALAVSGAKSYRPRPRHRPHEGPDHVHLGDRMRFTSDVLAVVPLLPLASAATNCNSPRRCVR